MRILARYWFVALLCFGVMPAAGNGQGTTIVFEEAGFPSPDSISVSPQVLRQSFHDARFVNAADLSVAVLEASTSLLVMPYGSGYPETAWPAILRYLESGRDLIVLGGKPFTRAAFRTSTGWQLRGPSVAASLELFIADYQETSGSNDLRFEANADVQPTLPAFTWKQAYSPVIRLSVTPLFPTEIGSTGDEDADLTTLAWGVRGEHKRAAPAFLIDHRQKRFVGGRWIFLACQPAESGFDASLLRAVATLALRKQDRFTFRPRLPLFLPGEALAFQYKPADQRLSILGNVLRVSFRAETGGTERSLEFTPDASGSFVLPPEAATGKGLHTVTATLLRNRVPLWTDHSAFWMRDLNYLRSGPKLTVGSDYFALDGKPLPVVGTTYMASDVHRLFLIKPNAYIWNRDMAQIHAAGLNMLRSGVWSGWSLITAPDGSVSEDALRTVEAFLMTARHNNLPVQFNLFAFLPDALGGEHPYLDPVALDLQDHYVRSIVQRFHDVPFLAWDLINEPSANSHTWKTLPVGDAFEQKAWRDWLRDAYPNDASLLAAWAEPSFGVGRSLEARPSSISPTVSAQDPLAMPTVGAFSFDGVRGGANPLKVYDYYRFTQKIFLDWVARQRATLRAVGSDQLVTVGQDEGGVASRLSPAFFSPEVSFTTDHTWWDFDSILWASLAAKMPKKPMLIQELGEQRRLMQDGQLRLSPEQEGWQLERKLAIAFLQGAGGLEWVWNVNAMMANDNETTIGAVRPDGTEKPEADVLAGFARFAGKSPESLGFIYLTPVPW